MITLEPITLSFKNVALTDEQFYQLCQDNENWQLERTAQGELIIMPPVGGISGKRESDLNAELWLWNRQNQLGQVFSSSTIFTLPSGAKRSPDVAWVKGDRWESLTLEEQENFPHYVPIL